MLEIRRLFPVILLVVGVWLASLGVTGAQDDPLTFAMVSHGGADIPFWRPVIQGMEDACALLEAECHWLSDPSFGGFEVMTGYWDDALALNPDGIATTAVDPAFVRAGVERATDLGIPVIIFNSDDPNAGTDEALSTLLYIGADEFGAGASNARRVFAEAEADGVTIQRGVCANNFTGFSTFDVRCAGVESVFEAEGVPLDQLPLNNDNSQTVDILTDYFADHPETNAILVPGLGSAYDLLQYMRRADLEPSQLYAATHDISPDVLQGIQDGYLLQTVSQQAYMQGFQTIMSLYLASQFGIRPSGNIYTNIVVDQSNLDEVSEVWEEGYR